ncbi:hypothetical protein CRG98_043003 [Punica granatum]|uniref:Uncharacterized protein n=1 Tax=Punica granatum TaxID=22663 RepID=A0A2I0HY81_PUNGR|nr:hypothetical protein CRG98_043003 [Punica granatum]
MATPSHMRLSRVPGKADTPKPRCMRHAHMCSDEIKIRRIFLNNPSANRFRTRHEPMQYRGQLAVNCTPPPAEKKKDDATLLEDLKDHIDEFIHLFMHGFVLQAEDAEGTNTILPPPAA